MHPRHLAPLVILMALGCGTPHAPVEGQVVFDDGQPAAELAGGSVVFESIDVTPKLSARGSIDAQGRFKLGTDKVGDGVPLGKYRALVAAPLTVEMDESKGVGAPLIDPRFQRFDTSELQFEVGSSKNDITIKVSRPAQ